MTAVTPDPTVVPQHQGPAMLAVAAVLGVLLVLLVLPLVLVVVWVCRRNKPRYRPLVLTGPLEDSRPWRSVGRRSLWAEPLPEPAQTSGPPLDTRWGLQTGPQGPPSSQVDKAWVERNSLGGMWLSRTGFGHRWFRTPPTWTWIIYRTLV